MSASETTVCLEPTVARSTSGLFGIGQVLAQLKTDFPDLSQSKIRFLEDQGLISPQRTSAGYRKFGESDVDRIRLILVLQRDHHMPLTAILEHLSALDAGEPGAALSLKPQLVPPTTRSTPQTRVRRREFLVLTGATPELLAELEQFDLVCPSNTGFFNQRDLDITALAVEMHNYGIEPRHLRMFKTAAERELDLVDQVVSPLRRSRTAGQTNQADQVHDALLGLCVRFHAALLGIGTGQRPT